MRRRRLFAFLAFLFLAAHLPALANRVFVSARTGNNANSCDNIATPCQTFAGAVLQLNPDGEVIVLDSGGYGPVTITQGVTIEVPPGVTAFIHPPSGDAITINAGSSDVVTLRGLVLNVGTNSAITVNSVGTLNVENCLITGFVFTGIRMNTAGRLNMREVNIHACFRGVQIAIASGVVQASVDHCHFDGNSIGFSAETTAPGSSTTIATNTTANNNSVTGWVCGDTTSGQDVLNLEFCTGSENAFGGLFAGSTTALSAVRYSNCVFANNGERGVEQFNASTVQSRGNNTITGNVLAPTSGTIGTFLPM